MNTSGGLRCDEIANVFMTLPLRIENDEIPSFIAGCAVNALRWEVDGMHYDQWASNYEGGDDPFAAWRDEIVTLYLQRQFQALEVHEDGRMLSQATHEITSRRSTRHASEEENTVPVHAQRSTIADG